MQIETPAMMRESPSKVCKPCIFSPRAAPAAAVAPKVTAFVTGTATVMGLSLSVTKNRAEADRFIKKGREYCHKHIIVTHSCRYPCNQENKPPCFFFSFISCFILLSAMTAPRFIRAFVTPHTMPMAISQMKAMYAFKNFKN